MQASVQGIDGSLCAPKCDAQNQCPSDLPEGTKAKAKCMLQDSQSRDKYCALQCSVDGQCPEGSKCGKLGPIGVCAFPDTTPTSAHTVYLQKTRGPPRL